MIRTYSYALDKNVKLQPNFKVGEFRCKDGTDKILIDDDIPAYLQRIRNACGGKSITISSGYRTDVYNKKIGGSTNSKHCLGRAADFYQKGKTSIQVACLAECMGIPGIEIISNLYLHIDTRTTAKWRSIQGRDGATRTYTTLSALGYSSFFGYGNLTLRDLKADNPFTEPSITVCKGSKGDGVRWMQWQLVLGGYLPLLKDGKNQIDGSAGEATIDALMRFQNVKGLEADGRCGSLTRSYLREAK